MSVSEDVQSILKAEATRLGFDLVGICAAQPAPHLDFYKRWIDRGNHAGMEYLQRHESLKATPENLLPGCRSIIAVGLNYKQAAPYEPGEPRIASYALGRDYHRILRARLKRLSAWMEAQVPGVQTRACVDSAPIFERDYARLAGLGWFGKNTCLINSKRGSWFFIGLLLTTADLEPDIAAVGGCGTCRDCIDACPTGAIIFEDGRWQVDSRSCISYLTIEHRGEFDAKLAKRIGSWTFGCDVCQDVCPFNHSRPNQPMRAASSQDPDILQSRKWPSLVELARLGEDDWDALSSGSAIRRTGLEGIRRNARANLENLDA